MSAERSDFNGKPVLILRNDENDRFPFSFGLSKARKILNHLDDIKKFVEDHTKDKDE